MTFPSPTLYPSPTLFPGQGPNPGGGGGSGGGGGGGGGGPTLTTFTEGIQNSLAPWITSQADPQGVLQAINAAYAAMFEQVWAIVSDQGSPDDADTYAAGWSTILNDQTCPTQFLPFLGQFVGVFVAPGTQDATARSLIAQEQGFQRGIPAAMIAAAQRFLTGSQSCILLERTPDPYTVTMVMRPEQLINQSALEQAVNQIKPAGILVDFVFTDGEIWTEANRTWNSDTTTWNSKGG